MEIRYPSYYKKFHCIAGDCPDTCCAGWEIPVDRVSEKRYQEAQKNLKHTKPDFAKKLKKYIKGGQIISEDVTCPFLNRDGLCEMYIELGPDALCNTCKRHPRHMEDYGNLHEMVLLLSCPEAARLVLEEKKGGYYVRHLPERHGDLEGIDVELLEMLIRLRELIWTIAGDRRWSVDQRMAYALALGHDVQRRISSKGYDEIGAVLEKYGTSGSIERFFKQWNGKYERIPFMKDLVEAFAKLDTVYQNWPILMERSRKRFCHSGGSKRQYDEIENVDLEFGIKVEEAKKRIFEYYIYSFLLSALYDEDVLTKIKMAVCCTLMTAELYYADQDRNTDLTRCYVVARQVENSWENRSALETIMKKETFASRRLIDALISE